MYTVKIENKHYDLSKFKNNHPGGEKFIALFSNQDATNAFQSYHGRVFPHKQMEKYLIKTDTSDISKIDDKYLKLCIFVYMVCIHHGIFFVFVT